MSLALNKNIGGTRLSVGDVDLTQPLDLTHSLLRDVQGFWLPLPHLVGGTSFFDLSSRGRAASLTNTGWASDPQYTFVETQSNSSADTELIPSDVDARTLAAHFQISNHDDSNRFGDNDGRFYLGDDNNNGFIWGVGSNFLFSNTPTDRAGEWVTVVGTLKKDNDTARIYVDGILENTGTGHSLPTSSANFDLVRREGSSAQVKYQRAVLVSTEPWDEEMASAWDTQARRGFPGLLNTRSRVFGLAGTGGAVSGTLALTDQGETIVGQGGTIASGTLSLTDGLETVAAQGGAFVSGTATITDAQENVQVIGDVTVAGAVAVTDQEETVNLSGSPLVGGTLSVTEGQEIFAGVGDVVVSATLSVTESGEIVAFTSSQVIGGTLSATDQGETISGQGQTLIAGTATLTDGREAVVVLGSTLVTGSGEIIDAGEIISGGGTVEISGTLSVVDGQEDVNFLSVEPPRLATLDMVLRDALQLDVTLTDTITLDVTLSDTITLDVTIQD